MVYSSDTAKRYGSEITVIECRFCGEGFDFWDELGEHLSYEHEDEVEKQEIKNQHLEGQHRNINPSNCPLCKSEKETDAGGT